MNLTFKIHDNYTQEFRFTNLIKNPIQIQRITTNSNNFTTIGLVLNNINNARQSKNVSKQSPIIWINTGYNSEITDIVVPPTYKWDFYLIDQNENNISANYDIDVNLICKLKL